MTGQRAGRPGSAESKNASGKLGRASGESELRKEVVPGIAARGSRGRGCRQRFPRACPGSHRPSPGMPWEPSPATGDALGAIARPRLLLLGGTGMKGPVWGNRDSAHGAENEAAKALLRSREPPSVPCAHVGLGCQGCRGITSNW
ncbi:uncharacterized protein LOC143692650 [Agelaius phoeniceus]|uniref:uncharacterized protein LOC143692650 n=1 Tax=Agelaius phoeniceus TaxID=39638 RepID=UPI0040551D54